MSHIYRCLRCGTPITGGTYCGRSTCGIESRFSFTPYQPFPPVKIDEGCRPFRALTEADVRRIVREEIATLSGTGDGK